jgi:hypothetical protein
MSQEQIERARVKLPDTFQPTDNASNADLFWIGIDAGHIEAYHGGARAVAQSLPRLPHWAGNERRHVAYFCSDGAEPTGLPCIMFRQSFYKDRADENSIAWPYAVEDFGALVTDDFSSLKYDVSFVGSKASSKSRIESFDSVAMTPQLDSFLDDSRMHWGSIEHAETGKQRKALFVKSMRESALVLAARGGGLSCYRFLEAMSAGRVPVLLADDWVLPHIDLINWEHIIIQIPECRAKDTGSILLEYLRRISDEELAEMGRECRLAWTQYLAPAVWPAMMERCVRGRL